MLAEAGELPSVRESFARQFVDPVQLGPGRGESGKETMNDTTSTRPTGAAGLYVSDDQDLTGLRDICSRPTGQLTRGDIWPKGVGRPRGPGSMRYRRRGLPDADAPARAGRTIDRRWE